MLCKSRPLQALELFCTLFVCLSVVLSGVHVAIAFPPNLTQIDDVSIATNSPLFNGQAIVDDVPAGSASNALATVLLEQWAWGDIASPQVQRMAQATITYGIRHPDLLKLARLGSNDGCSGNFRRDLQRFVKLSNNMANTVAIALPLETTMTGGNSQCAHDALRQVIGMLL